jgi:hypothetical protein
MNALIFVIVLLFVNADISPAGVAVVWAFLVFLEWLADRFAGSLLHGWAAYWSALRTARAGSRNLGQVG